jgi:hypothetical protein
MIRDIEEKSIPSACDDPHDGTDWSYILHNGTRSRTCAQNAANHYAIDHAQQGDKPEMLVTGPFAKGIEGGF